MFEFNRKYQIDTNAALTREKITSDERMQKKDIECRERMHDKQIEADIKLAKINTSTEWSDINEEVR